MDRDFNVHEQNHSSSKLELQNSKLELQSVKKELTSVRRELEQTKLQLADTQKTLQERNDLLRRMLQIVDNVHNLKNEIQSVAPELIDVTEILPMPNESSSIHGKTDSICTKDQFRKKRTSRTERKYVSHGGSKPRHLRSPRSYIPGEIDEDVMSLSSSARTRPVTGFASYNELVGKGEDRIMRIQDLEAFITKLNVIDSMKTYLPEFNHEFLDCQDLITKAKENARFAQGISLFGVFDGHMGRIAAEFVQVRFSLNLLSNQAFTSGDYEHALKSAAIDTHNSLRDYPSYKQEKLEQSNSPAGTTFSVALSTAKTTYFALLGDSPIFYLVRRRKHRSPTDPNQSDFSEVLPIQGWHGADRERLIKSNFPIICNETRFILPFTGAYGSKKLKDKRLRPGLVGLEPSGGIGDMIYDSEIWNAFLQLLDRYKIERFMEHVDLVAKQCNYESKDPGIARVHDIVKNNKMYEHIYKLMKDFFESQKEYQMHLKRHYYMSDKWDEDYQQMELLRMYLLADEQQVLKMKLDPDTELVRRTPVIRVIPNKEMRFYCLMSDGVMNDPNRRKYHQSNVIRIVNIKNSKSHPSAYSKNLMRYFKRDPEMKTMTKAS